MPAGHRLSSLVIRLWKDGEPMKVLFVNGVDTALQLPGGGDAVQMRETQRALEDLGVEVGWDRGPEPDATGYDVVHVFNLQLPDFALAKIRHLKRFGVPIVLSAIWWDPAEFTWAATVLDQVYLRYPTFVEREPYLSLLADRRLVFGGLQFAHQVPAHDPWLIHQREILGLVDLVLVSAAAELSRLQQTLGLADFRWRVVPNAVDPAIFSPPEAEAQKRRGFSNYVLSCVRWCDHRKNVLLLGEAMRDIDAQLVIVGRRDESGRHRLVEATLPSRSKILDYLPHEELVDLYRNALVHAMPSWYETPGLSSLEAAACGVPIVVGNRSAEAEYFREAAYYCDPANYLDIRRAIKAAIANRDLDAIRRRKLRARILSQFVWRAAASATLAAYREAIASRRRAAA